MHLIQNAKAVLKREFTWRFRRWQYETGNGFRRYPALNPHALNRQHKRYLRSLTLRRQQLLDEIKPVSAELKTFMRPGAQANAPRVFTFNTVLDWGDPVTLTGASELMIHLEQLHAELTRVSELIKSSNLGSSDDSSDSNRRHLRVVGD